MEKDRIYIAIDLKSFYASVECMDRGLDPLTTNLVVADQSRTEKTICLAVSPSLKQYGIPGRARLFEVISKVKEVNQQRKSKLKQNAGFTTTFSDSKNSGRSTFSGQSYDDMVLKEHPDFAVDYIVAPPRMAKYLEESVKIYNIYLRYVAPEDIHVYSIDEVMMDVTNYMKAWGKTPRDLAAQMIQDIMETTGITATAGIGTNLYLCKVAMDLQAKHEQPDAKGVRIAFLDERSYREKLWNHRPLTDFWRVGRGYAKKLEENGLYTMGDIARCSLGAENEYHNEDLLYKLFGVNAELLIDHAWGWEPCTMDLVKAYKPESNCVSSGQVLTGPYPFEQAKLVAREMADQLALDLVDKGLMTDQLVITIGYDIDNLTDSIIRKQYHGEVTIDHYGRRVPKHAHGTKNLSGFSASTKVFMDAVSDFFDEVVNPILLVRRLNITANHLMKESEYKREQEEAFEQLDLFTDYSVKEEVKKEEDARLEKERKLQEAMLSVKKRYGKNAMLKGMNLQEGATTMLRNDQIGGHKA